MRIEVCTDCVPRTVPIPGAVGAELPESTVRTYTVVHKCLRVCTGFKYLLRLDFKLFRTQYTLKPKSLRKLDKRTYKEHI
jgi:hypothetical protein